MMKFVYALVALFALISGLIVQAPAAMFASLVQNRLQQRVNVTNLSGDFWNGRGHVDCVLADKTSQSCGDWAWKFVPASLSEARIRWTLMGSNPGERMTLYWSFAGLQAESMELGLPAAMLVETQPKLAALQLRGRLKLSANKLDGKDGRIEIKWMGLSSRLAPSIDLGEHTLSLIASPAGWKLGLSTLVGPISLLGDGEINRQRQATLTASVTLTEVPQRAKLAPFLDMLGAESSPGVWSLTLP